MLTDEEIDELEMLIKLKEVSIFRTKLNHVTDGVNPNYALLHKSIEDQKYNEKGDLIDGFRGVALEGSSRCFNKNQLVVTSKGLKEISAIKIGEYVKSLNQSTKEIEYKKVLNNFKIENKKPCFRINLKDGTVIECTEDHKFLFNGIWTEIKDILDESKDINKRKKNRS